MDVHSGVAALRQGRLQSTTPRRERPNRHQAIPRHTASWTPPSPPYSRWSVRTSTPGPPEEAPLRRTRTGTTPVTRVETHTRHFDTGCDRRTRPHDRRANTQRTAIILRVDGFRPYCRTRPV
ncbi:MAG: hypothetical protein F4223_03270 [Rhodobacteraceae bacterium]|nr:hypothetical protein [Paracoccaceae bacterium]